MDIAALPASRASSPPADTRRIALQSPADLMHLRALALRAARHKIDMTLPFEAAVRDAVTGVTTDALRAQVEADVAGYLDRTFEAVRPGVEINGMVPGPGWEGEEEVEGYDVELAARVQAMYTRVAELNLEVAEVRRRAGGEAKREFGEAWRGVRKEDARAVEAAEGEADAVSAEGMLGKEGLGWGERAEAVRVNWEEGVGGAGRVGEEVRRAEEKASRAEKVVGVLDASKG